MRQEWARHEGADELSPVRVQAMRDTHSQGYTQPKLIFCDMDGTLLDNHHHLPPMFDDVMEKVLRHDAIFIPTSWQRYPALAHQLERYRDSFIFVADDGAIAMHGDAELFSVAMRQEDVLRVLEIGLRIPDAYMVLCGKQNTYVTSEWRPYISDMGDYFLQNEVVNDLLETASQQEIVKVAFFDLENYNARKTIYPALCDLEGNIQVVVSGGYCVEVTAVGVSKGNAVRRLQNLLQISPDQCAAFGDGLNDVDMLQAVKYGYAMANANPSVKEAAPFEAPANTEYGVMTTLLEMFS